MTNLPKFITGGRTGFIQKCACVTEREEILQRQAEQAEYEQKRKHECAARAYRFRLLGFEPDIPEEFDVDHLEVHDGNDQAIIYVAEYAKAAVERGHTRDLPGFALWGRNSIGKTHLIKALAKLLQENDIGAVVLNARIVNKALTEEFDKAIPAFNFNKFFDDCCFVPFLAFDDLGKGKGTTLDGSGANRFQTFLWNVVDARIERGLATFITTNFSAEGIVDKYLGANDFGFGFMDRLIQGYGKDPTRWLEITDTQNRRRLEAR